MTVDPRRIAVGDKIQAPIPGDPGSEEQRIGIVTDISGDQVTYVATGVYDMHYGPGDDDYYSDYANPAECVVPLSTVTYHWPQDK